MQNLKHGFWILTIHPRGKSIKLNVGRILELESNYDSRTHI